MTVITHTLDNGLQLLIEPMSHVQSAAYDLQFPGGVLVDNAERIGESLILADLTSRGAGPYTSRELSDQFDDLGIRHAESAGGDRFAFRGNCLFDVLPRALELMSYSVLSPHLPEDEIEPIRNLMLQDIESLRDNPPRLAFFELASRYYPAPFNRPMHGDAAGIMQVTSATARDLLKKTFCPKGAVLSCAGRVEPEVIIAQAQKLYGGWQGSTIELPNFAGHPKASNYHIPFEGAQVQLVTVCPGPKFGDEFYYVAKVLNEILSGGMFGRLFIEIREKRGLVYSAYSRHIGNKALGVFQCYAGTTPENVQETIEVLNVELSRLKKSVSEDELVRAKINLKAALVIGEESSSSRASSNASDWMLCGKVRPMESILAALEKVSSKDIDEYLERFPFDQQTVLTLGSAGVKI